MRTGNVRIGDDSGVRKARVLIVEPDAVLAKTYAQVLAQAGYEVATAASAQTAIDAADNSTPDCIVLELQLPGHNGIEFLYELRSYADWQHVPVIIHSFTPLSKFVAVQPVLVTLGVARVLYKPNTRLQQLSASVREVLEPRASAAIEVGAVAA